MTRADFESHVAALFVKPADRVGRLVHAAVGCGTEAGELLDAVKKSWIYGAALDEENVLEECGDQLFYVTAMLLECGFTLDDAMEHNKRKLRERYPEGYTDAAARERADKGG